MSSYSALLFLFQKAVLTAFNDLVGKDFFAQNLCSGSNQCPNLSDYLMTPNISKNSSISGSTSNQNLPTSFLNVLNKSSPIKMSQTGILHFHDLQTPVKALNVDVTPRRMSQDEESLTTPPSEGYFEPSKTPGKKKLAEESSLSKCITPVSKTSFSDVNISGGKTPSKSRQVDRTPTTFTMDDEESLITPPSERYATATGDKIDVLIAKTPRKNIALLGTPS